MQYVLAIAIAILKLRFNRPCPLAPRLWHTPALRQLRPAFQFCGHLEDGIDDITCAEGEPLSGLARGSKEPTWARPTERVIAALGKTLEKFVELRGSGRSIPDR